MFNEFITLDMLKVYLVAVCATVVFTEFFKEAVDSLFKIFNLHMPTKYVVFFWATLVVFLPIYFDSLITPEAIATGIINAILLTLTAQKSYETILEKSIIKITKEKEA